MASLLTGIDLGTSSIKIVQGQMKGPLLQLLRAAEIPIEPDGDTEVEILQAIQGQVPGLKLKPGLVRLGVTGRDLMIRYTTVPPVPLWRLKMLMDFEVQDMAASSGDPLTADYNLLGAGSEDGDETVLVSLVKSHFLDSRLRALKGAGVDVRATTPNCVSLFNAFLAFGDLHDEEYTFLLDIGDQNLEMAIQRDGDLLFARNVSGGGSMFTRAICEAWSVSPGKARQLKHQYGNVTPRGKASYESSEEEKVANAIMGVAGQLSGMVQSTMNFARNQSGLRDMQIGRVVVSGGGSALTGLDAYLAQNLSVPVERFVPENALDLSALSPDEVETFDADPSAFVCALGLARMSQDDDAFVIDLVPEATKRKRAFVQRTLYVILAGVAAAVFLGVLWFDLSAEEKETAEQRKAAKRKERTAVHVRNRYEDKVTEALLVKSKIDRLAWESRAGTYLLRGQALVQRNAPESIWIRTISVTRKPVPVPGKEDLGKKGMVEKVLVTVRGEIHQLGEGVTSTYNKFIESLRGDAGKPVVETTDRPSDAGGEFEVTLDFAGWPAPDEPAGEEDEES